MFLNDLFFLFLLICILNTVFFINQANSLFFLLASEFLWVTLYLIVLIVSFDLNNLSILSLSFFFLIISAIEFSIGSLLVYFQFIFLRTLNLNSTTLIKFKYFLKKK